MSEQIGLLCGVIQITIWGEQVGLFYWVIQVTVCGEQIFWYMRYYSLRYRVNRAGCYMGCTGYCMW
jgi:hypothetical protein